MRPSRDPVSVHDSRPGDLECAVLKHRREATPGIGRCVPGALEMRLVEQRARSSARRGRASTSSRVLFHSARRPSSSPPPEWRAAARGRGGSHQARGTGSWRGRSRTGRIARRAARACTRSHSMSGEVDVAYSAGRRNGHVGAVPARDLRDLLRVRRDDHALEARRSAAPVVDRVREQRVTGERADVLVGDPLGARARADEADHAGHCSRSVSKVGVGTPSRRPARTTATAIASSSDGRPAVTSRSVDEVAQSGKDSMIAHCSSNVVWAPSAAATAHASSTAERSRGSNRARRSSGLARRSGGRSAPAGRASPRARLRRSLRPACRCPPARAGREPHSRRRSRPPESAGRSAWATPGNPRSGRSSLPRRWETSGAARPCARGR